jgi:hypothetical protein
MCKKQQPTKIYIMKTVSSIVENYIKKSPFTKCIIIRHYQLDLIIKNIMTELESDFGRSETRCWWWR